MPEHYPLFYTFHFYFFGVIALASAIAFVTRKSPVAAALWLVTTMFALAAEYILLDAQFIGIMQVLVYAGAIMVVFLFVVMLLNLGNPSEIADARGRWPVVVSAFIGLALLAFLGATVSGGISWKFAVPAGYNAAQLGKYGAVGTVARPLFNEYLLAFELTSVLLLVAVAGAVVLGKRRDSDAR
ncbi:MAG TPA: NADH-quinone oxidoreductase subunit J [Gemmatimonadaceae bacterium]